QADRTTAVAGRYHIQLLFALTRARKRIAFARTRAIAQRGVEAAERRAVVGHDVRLAAARRGKCVGEAERAVHRLVDVVRAGLHDDAVAVERRLAAEAHIAPVSADTRVRVARRPGAGRGIRRSALAVGAARID